MTQVWKSHPTLTSSLVNVKYFQRCVNVIIINLQLHKQFMFSDIEVTHGKVKDGKCQWVLLYLSIHSLLFKHKKLKQTSPMEQWIDNDDICTSVKVFTSPNYWWVLDKSLTFKSPHSFSKGTYTESDNALHSRGFWLWQTTCYLHCARVFDVTNTTVTHMLAGTCNMSV